MKIFTIIVFATIFLSCKKDDQNSPDSPSTPGSISYKVNGVQVTMDNKNLLSGEGVMFAKQLEGSVVASTRYLMNAQKGVNNLSTFAIVTDSLKTTNYHYDSAYNNKNFGLFMFTVMADGNQSMLYYNSDYLDINITSYKNGRISGTFSAKTTPMKGGLNYDNKGTILITDGKLNNVPVTY